ncbi:MAG: hypothetical protein JNJ40_15905 [Bacteroidia bacterium]|nr:hypothetical protein [Bacteroidia bacterium]
MENEINNQDPKEKITNTPDPNETGTNKNDGGKNPKLPGTDPDQTPEKEVEDPPVANPNKDSDTNYPNRKKIGFNNN